MRKIHSLVLLVFLFVQGALFGQGAEPTNAQAKTYYKSFNTAISKLETFGPTTSKAMYQQQLQSAETSLKSIVKYEPGYDAKPLESKLAGYQKKFTDTYLAKEMDADVAAMREKIAALREGRVPAGFTSQRYLPSDLERDFGAFKKKYPSYDASALDKEVKDALAKQSSDSNAADAAKMSRGNTGERIEAFFEAIEATCLIREATKTADMEQCRAQLDALKREGADIQAAVAGASDAERASYLNYAEDGIQEIAGDVDAQLDQWVGFVNKEATDLHGLETYYKVLYYQAYFETASKAFPSVSDGGRVFASLNQAVSSMGSLSSVESKIRARRLEQAKNAKMPAAIRQDAGIEAEFKRVFESQGWNETCLKVHLASNDWALIKDAVTGKTLGRAQQAYIGAKLPNGDCRVYSFGIQQDYNGGSFGSSRHYSNGIEHDICPCENIK